MACPPSVLIPASCAVAPSGFASGQGFLLSVPGARGCCSTPCPGFPLHTVKVCLRLNEYTIASVAVGCVTTSEEVPIISYSWPTTYTSNGRRCRDVAFEQTVPHGSLLRIRLCPNSAICAASCPDRTNPAYIPNALSKFTIDGLDWSDEILDLANAGGSYPGDARPYAHSWCTSAALNVDVNFDDADDEPIKPGCCAYGLPDIEAAPLVFWDAGSTGSDNTLTDLPMGAEIVVGRIGFA